MTEYDLSVVVTTLESYRINADSPQEAVELAEAGGAEFHDTIDVQSDEVVSVWEGGTQVGYKTECDGWAWTPEEIASKQGAA